MFFYFSQTKKEPLNQGILKALVEATGFEPATSASRTQRSTKLSHASLFCFQLFVCCSTARAIILEFLSFVNRKNQNFSKKSNFLFFTTSGLYFRRPEVVSGKVFYISVIIFQMEYQRILLYCNCHFLCNSVTAYIDNSFSFFHTFDNTLAAYRCNFCIAASVSDLCL